MAKLPDDTALGQLPSASSGRPIATYDTTGYDRGAAAIGGGVSDIGKGVSSAVKDVTAVQASEATKSDELDQAKAQANYLIQTKQIRDKLSTETDPAKLDETYAPQFQKAQEDSAALISNPRARELWTLKTAPDVAGHVIAVGDKTFELHKTNEIAGAQDKLDQIRQSALTTQDPAARAEFIRSGQHLIGSLKDAGYIDAVTEQKYRTKWTQDYAIGAVSILPPEEQVKVLTPTVQSRDDVLDRIGGIENSTGNPAARNSTSSAMGNFGFTNKTWLDTVQAHRPDLLQGRDTKTVLDLRADPKLSREMAGYLTDDNAAILRSQGITTTPANLYLAHFLGVDAAAKVIKAPPGTPIADIVSPAAIEANKSLLAGKTTDTVAAWSAQKMGGTNRAAPQFASYSLPGKESALIEYHRDNLRNGTYVENGGDISTVYITGVTGPDGKIYNVPGFWDGKLHTDVKEITDHAAASGWDKWPSYKDGKTADAAAERDHKIVEDDTNKFRESKVKRSGNPIDFIPEDKRVDMLHTATEQVAAGSADQQRAAKLALQQAKDKSDAAEIGYMQDLESDNPKTTALAITKDPNLSREAIERLVTRAHAALADTKAVKTYGEGFYDAYQKVHSPEGTPGRITDPTELYSRVGPKGDLTVAGVDKLVNEIQARKSPEGVAESEMKKQFLANAKAQISGSDEGLHIKDPKGDELYLKWLAHALPDYDKARKEGKSPAELLNPESPGYLGKSITGFKRPMDQWFSDIVHDSPKGAAPAAVAFDPKTVKSLDDLVSAYRSGKVPKAVADQLAIDKGWAAKRAAAVVPVSQ